jgi:hypothetical protein
VIGTPSGQAERGEAVLAFWIGFGLLALNTIASFRWISKALAILQERYEPI